MDWFERTHAMGSLTVWLAGGCACLVPAVVTAQWLRYPVSFPGHLTVEGRLLRVMTLVPKRDRSC